MEGGFREGVGSFHFSVEPNPMLHLCLYGGSKAQLLYQVTHFTGGTLTLLPHYISYYAGRQLPLPSVTPDYSKWSTQLRSSWTMSGPNSRTSTPSGPRGEQWKLLLTPNIKATTSLSSCHHRGTTSPSPPKIHTTLFFSRCYPIIQRPQSRSTLTEPPQQNFAHTQTFALCFLSYVLSLSCCNGYFFPLYKWCLLHCWSCLLLLHCMFWCTV